MIAPGVDVFVLCIAIAVALAIALPLARNWAGLRTGEPVESRRRSTRWGWIGAILWVSATGVLASSGALENWERVPPPIFLLLVVSVAGTIALASWKVGRSLAFGLPLWALVGYQAFRVAVEFMLHRAYEQGVIGVQMTWSGRNFDVVTGATALVLGLWLRFRGEARPIPRAIVWIWNLLGLALLLNIVTIAILSMPTRLRAFDGPPNAFVATFPWVWLPTVMVTAALFGHLLVARRLIGGPRGSARDSRSSR